MFDHKHYVPILKGKEAEYHSLQELDSATKSRLTPLIEIPSIPWNFTKDEQVTGVDTHLAKVAENLEACWGTKRPVFVDLWLISDMGPVTDGRHPLHVVFDEARGRGLQLIPVTGLSRGSEYQSAVRRIVEHDGRGVCIRIETEDLEQVDDLQAEFDGILASLQLKPAESDLVLDFRGVAAAGTSFIVLAAKALLKGLPFVSDWRTLTLAASAFPETYSGFASAEIGSAQRAEWIVWEALAKGRRAIPRLPAFGDYAGTHAEFTEVDPIIMRANVHFPYTTDRTWLILKGRDVKRYGYQQFNELCRTLVARPEYNGPGFSWGDAYINACASNAANAGHAATWRMVGATHHLAYVATQLARFNGT